MSTVDITAVKRELQNPREVRRAGRVPAVIYGHGINQLLELDVIQLEKVISSGAGRGLLDLTVMGEDPAKVMLKEVQRHPVRGDLLHVDFYRVSMTEMITTPVSLRIMGEEGATAEGAVVQYQLRQVDVQCLPGSIPTHLDVDLTGRGPGDAFTVSELEAPEGVTIVTDPATVVASLVIPRMVEEEVPVADEEGILDAEVDAERAAEESEQTPEEG